MIPASTDAAVRAEVEAKAKAAKDVSRRLGTVGTAAKNAALLAMADALGENCATILQANARDIASARDKGVAPHMVDRLALNPERIVAMQEGLRQVAALPDPIGDVLGGWRRPNGLQIEKVRVPLGVIGIIYESRPNVTVDAAALCLKAGNAVVLRGGSEAIHSNTALANVLRGALAGSELPPDAVNLIESTNRDAIQCLITANRFLDCIIPRGGAGLIQTVVQNATVPVIETGTGNCHVYIDASADLGMATDIVLNAKTQRPSTCNAAETLLIHASVSRDAIVEILQTLNNAGVEIRGCERTPMVDKRDRPATEEDYFTEFNDLILAVKIVDSLDDAISHINYYGTRHSEAIVTGDYAAAQQFTDEVDAAAVYVNASTRFTDGFEFGFGAEIGISNQKLHARGPMGLNELTTTKYIVRGSGQVR